MANDITRPEQDIKDIVARDWFSHLDCTHHYGNVDFAAICPADELGLNEDQPLYWAEAKKGTLKDIYDSMVQLILTIGKERPQDRVLPPHFIGAFDAEKISFMPYHCVLDVLSQNDFNWNVAPSNHNTKEFLLLSDLVRDEYNKNVVIFRFESEAKELKRFIAKNMRVGNKGTTQICITKNNFTNIYQQWVDQVKPSIDIDWDDVKKEGIIDADFYLADIMSSENVTIREKLNVLLCNDIYRIVTNVNKRNHRIYEEFVFCDGQKAHNVFWNKYKRPPRRDFWEFMITRRDLLVPQDIREIKGAYFTPKQWVRLSQQYLAEEFGENWQDDYYIWDCAAGTGNLLAGLTNKYNIYASTLDGQDVAVIRDRIQAMNAASSDGVSGSNLLDKHVFRFDFLNDPLDVDHIPQSLYDIINDSDKRKRLIVYINPPYKEAANAKTVTGSGNNVHDVSKTMVKDKYMKEYGDASNELSAQFFTRIHREISGCKIGMFAKLKHLSGPNFRNYRRAFPARLKKLYIANSSTFDNVDGKFPIGFHIWDTEQREVFSSIVADVYNNNAEKEGTKKVLSYDDTDYIKEWFRRYYDKQGGKLGYIRFLGTDFSNQRGVFITSSPSSNDLKQVKGTWITRYNLLISCVYFTVRHCIEATWWNDRDQFLYPHDTLNDDVEFICDCFVYTMFHGQNRISSAHGVNHWIPFTAQSMNTRERLASTFLSDYIAGCLTKEKRIEEGELFDRLVSNLPDGTCPIEFSKMAQDVMDAGLALFRYYHSKKDSNPNASLYDIKAYFQGYDQRGRMNATSSDPEYSTLLEDLRATHKKLVQKITPKIYYHGFLK